MISMEMAECELLTTSRARLRGLLGREPDARWHMLAPCKDVHTFGMGHELDIAFLDRNGEVLAAHRRVGRNGRLRCCGAVVTVERFARSGPWLEPGDRMALTIVREEGSEESDSRKEGR